LVVGTALNTLGEWYAILHTPGHRQSGGSVFASLEQLGEVIARAFVRLIRGGVEALYRFERSLLYASQQRAEYFADALACRIGSTDATAALLDVLHIADQCEQAVHFGARRGETDLWAIEKRYFDALPPKEWERKRRLDAERGTSIDATHPPTDLRIKLVEKSPSQPATITMDAAESAAVAAELVSAFDLVAKQMVGEGG
jgi:hypothetical protein